MGEDKGKGKGEAERTSSIAHLISSINILYIGGMICGGRLMRRSEKMKPGWGWGVDDGDGARRDWSVEWISGEEEVRERR